MSQQQMQQKANQAKEQSQAFSKTIINSTFEVFDAATSVLYYLLGAAYGVFAAILGVVKDPKLQNEAKEAVNGAADNLTDGAYDIKSRVKKNAGPAINDAKAKASDFSKQAQGTANDFSKQAQGTANDFSRNAQGTANDVSRNAQGKAADVKNQAVSQGKQAQGQAKQTARANGF